MVCREAASGNLEPRILGIDAEGELGQMLHDINHLLDITDAFVREAGAALEHAQREKFYRKVLESGMLGSFRRGAALINAASDQMKQKTDQLTEAHASRLQLADEFETAVKSVVDAVAAAATQVSATAETLAKNAGSISQEAQTAAGASEGANSNVITIASAIEELSSSVAELEKQVAISTQMTGSVSGEAQRSFETVSHLSQAGEKIGSVVNLIKDIAGQTNLLALNATIEAASAGEAGRGFAVVAAEVKSLARQTGGATEEITGQVEGIQSATGDVVTAIRGIGESISKIDETSKIFSSQLREQGLATNEISRSTQTAAQLTSEVSTSVRVVSEGAEETSRAASELLAASDELSRLAEGMRVEVDKFLDGVRAG